MAVRNGLVSVVSVTVVVVLGWALAGCAPDGDDSRAMSVGEQVALDAGCASCHGPNGEGGSGPKLRGLYGSEVTLADGSTVIADEAYLTEAIRNPAAKQTAGYGPMPVNSLSDTEIQAVVEFIKSLQATP